MMHLIAAVTALLAAQRDGGEASLSGGALPMPTHAVARIQACYETEQRLHPLAEGLVTARLTIAASGNVTDVTFAPYPDTTYYSQSFDACLTKEIRSWTFQKRDRADATFTKLSWHFHHQ